MTARTVTGRGGLEAIELTTEVGAITVYRQGAHLTSWVPAGGVEMLFVSTAARFATGSAIRGGAPVCFPQFAELGPLPMHGFAQVEVWDVVDVSATGVALALRDTPRTRGLWPHRFVAGIRIELAREALTIAFEVRNAGEAAFDWSGTLHTYLALDVRRTRIRGLGPAWYLDRARDSRRSEDRGKELVIPGHTDRAYLDAGAQVAVDDGSRRVLIGKRGFRDTVIWNPGPETSDRFADLRDDDHERFVCVEAAEVRRATVLPGATWSGAQTLRRTGALTLP